MIDFGLWPAQRGVKREGKTEIKPSNLDISQQAARGVNSGSLLGSALAMGLDSSVQISKPSSVQVAGAGREQLVGCRAITLTARLPSQNLSFTALASLPLPLLSQ